ncbi:sugar ABC transporter ATP-binding protein [Kallotenue papyrolyticum]|uniref:sugar ABC transporter ATP-binding protein n=1 Tax=Kallotenue papyrolyticum TaxID=1325125 RepID=UPI00047856DD|nr:sugar ABC transporter ATP-binding protein [Kallotenue papyrolyticum]
MAELLELRGISKRFGGIQALDSVDFSLRRGEVMALVGENGAGKSTLIKIIAGVHQPDSGTLAIDGQPVRLRTPAEAQRLGIAVIYQEFNLTPNQTVAENVFLHRPPRRPGLAGRLGLVDHRARAQATGALLNQLGAPIDPQRPVAELSVAQQQLTEIAKALAQNARIIIMDEPTSALPDEEVEVLLAIVRRLRERGVTIVFVSHRLEEIRRIADRVTVLRDGRLVAVLPISEASDERLISLMVGRAIDHLFPKTPLTPGDEVLRVEGLSRRGVLHNVSFSLRRGEILGLAGLIGAGRTETARCIFGADRADSGRILLAGRPVTIRSPRDAVALGIGYVPEDRKQQGLVLEMSVRHNITLGVLHRLTRAGLVRWPAVDRLAYDYAQRLRLRPARIDLPVVQLSGGNQQKVVLAKWLALQPRVLILDEPTRGIDVGAKAEVHALIDQLAQAGIGILLISSELPEVLSMSDRILVMAEGEIVGELSRAQATQERVLELASLKARQRLVATG